MTLYRFEGHSPALPASGNCFVAPGARLVGQVTLGEMASVWFNAVLRGDNEPIVIGEGTNVQDNAVCHTDPGFPLTVGRDVTIGHSAIVHGCTIGDGTLIGMGATVMNGAKIGRFCLIGAGAMVTEGKEIPDFSMVLGQPGKVVRTLDEEAGRALVRAADAYKDKTERYRQGLATI